MGSVSRGVIWCFIGCVCGTYFAYCRYDNIDSLILVFFFVTPCVLGNFCYLLLVVFFPFILSFCGGWGGGVLVAVASLLSYLKLS